MSTTRLFSKFDFKIDDSSSAAKTLPPRAQISWVSSTYDEDFTVWVFLSVFCRHTSYQKWFHGVKTLKTRQENSPFTEQRFALRVNGHRTKSIYIHFKSMVWGKFYHTICNSNQSPECVAFVFSNIWVKCQKLFEGAERY